MALNSTGAGDTREYVLGRGGVYLAQISATTGYPLAYRFLGNAPEFAVNMDVQELLHFSSQRGLKVADKRVEISRTIGLSFKLDEVSQQNLAMFFGGTNANVTNPAVAGFGTAMAPITITATAELGVWYDLRNAAGTRCMIEDPTKLVVLSGNMSPITLGADDYSLDEDTGRIFLITAAAGGDAVVGEALTFYVSADVSAAATLQQMEALADTQRNYALKFISLNASESDEMREFQFHSVSISPDGDSALLGDDWMVMGFKGSAQVNSLLAKTLTITTLPRA